MKVQKVSLNKIVVIDDDANDIILVIAARLFKLLSNFIILKFKYSTTNITIKINVY